MFRSRRSHSLFPGCTSLLNGGSVDLSSLPFLSVSAVHAWCESSISSSMTTRNVSRKQKTVLSLPLMRALRVLRQLLMVALLLELLSHRWLLGTEMLPARTRVVQSCNECISCREPPPSPDLVATTGYARPPLRSAPAYRHAPPSPGRYIKLQ